jgi:dUTP pyrophosphatase
MLMPGPLGPQLVRSPVSGIRVSPVLEVPLVRLDPDLPVPSYAHQGDAGADLYAREDIALAPGGGRALVPTGIALALPPGYAGFVLPRSGLALRHGVTCLNTPGLIDAGYRDELRVLLVNTDPSEPYEVKRGDRIAQLVIQSVEEAKFSETSQGELPDSTRGLGGFGHTGR